MSWFGKRRNEPESDSEGEPYFGIGVYFFVLMGYLVYYMDSFVWVLSQ